MKNRSWCNKCKRNYSKELKVPGPERIWYVADAFRHGFSLDDVFEATKIDRWFLIQIQDIVNTEAQVKL